jgi:uncharacterized membrane protein YeaQ/YmgE (transglycosylase-associated protein family)
MSIESQGAFTAQNILSMLNVCSPIATLELIEVVTATVGSIEIISLFAISAPCVK